MNEFLPQEQPRRIRLVLGRVTALTIGDDRLAHRLRMAQRLRDPSQTLLSFAVTGVWCRFKTPTRSVSEDEGVECRPGFNREVARPARWSRLSFALSSIRAEQFRAN